MNYIFIDLEFNQPYRRFRNPNLLFEIMEIGAVKTDESLNVIDTFRIYIKNRVYKRINPYVAKITGIKQEDLNYGFEFNKAYRIFRSWIGEEDFKVFAFSNSDEMVLTENLKYHNLENKQFENIIDIQKEIMTKMNMCNMPSLKDCCEIYDVNVDDETIHRALVDTMLLVKLYKKFTNSNLTVLEMIEKVDERYKHLFSLSRKITVEEAMELDKRKYRVTCPKCKKQLRKNMVYYNGKNKKIYTVSICDECNQEIVMKFLPKKDIKTNEITIVKKDYVDIFSETKKFIALDQC